MTECWYCKRPLTLEAGEWLDDVHTYPLSRADCPEAPGYSSPLIVAPHLPASLVPPSLERLALEHWLDAD